MYGLREYARMFRDENRNRAYAAALARVLPEGGTVLDIGTGAGMLAILACRAGATRVFAVDSTPIIELARVLAERNSYGDRIVFIEQSTRTIDLPAPVDVVMADIRGTLPLIGDSVATLIDARERLLRPGGAMIPVREHIFGAVASAPALWEDGVAVWDASAYGLDVAPGRLMSANSLMGFSQGDALLSDAARWTTLEYDAVQSTSVRSTLAWTIRRPGTAHGFELWFEAELAEGVILSAAPGSGDRLYGRLFLFWPEPVVLGGGERVEVWLRADASGDEYVWTWRSLIERPGQPRLEFAQSTFLGEPLSRGWLDRHARREH